MEELDLEEPEARGPQRFVRFSLSQRLEHLVLMLIFLALVLTGLPQRFYDHPWSQWTVLHLGGIDNTRFLHRTFALVFMGQALYHLVTVVHLATRGRLRPTIVPTLKDVSDAWQMLRYSLGVAEERPKFDRYTYGQKFEYWGIISGGMVMIITGLFLWFPLVVTRALPGEVVAAAKEAHGNEALLALLVIVVWHLYAVLLSPAFFPGDYSIFTGYISKHRMREEHPLEYLRLTASANSSLQKEVRGDALA